MRPILMSRMGPVQFAGRRPDAQRLLTASCVLLIDGLIATNSSATTGNLAPMIQSLRAELLVGLCSGRRNRQNLSRKDEVGIADLLVVREPDLRPHQRIAVSRLL